MDTTFPFTASMLEKNITHLCKHDYVTPVWADKYLFSAC